jgi:hypothetical protein
MDAYKLRQLKEEIEYLDKGEYYEILKIIQKYNNKYTENNNGIFINMNKLTDDTISDIEKFLKFSNENNKMLETHDIEINKYIEKLN